jgi:methylated-DNA-protein-cysteine methyltransferase-like protein
MEHNPNYALYEKIYTVAEQIPPGMVATYGDIAAIVGGGCDARTVGFALNELPQDRVIMSRYHWAGPSAAWAAEHGFNTLPPRDDAEQLSLF